MKPFFSLPLLLATSLVSIFPLRVMAQSQQELVEQGKYILTALQGCGCHTREDRDGSKDMNWHLAGAPSQPPPAGPSPNVGWTNPKWKKLYARNITPDPETGIGKWTESDFMAAMKTGKTPERRIMDPFMPWPHFQGITGRDLKAMWAYLRTIKPIKNKVPESIPAQK